jgi:hypothetical protein
MSDADKMMALFAGFAGAHGTHGPPDRDGNKWHIKRTAQTLREPVTVELWELHLAGARPLGVIPIREDSLCQWGSIDVDDYSADLLAVVRDVEAQKLPLVPCRSKSGGLHLFLFTTEPVPAGELQAALRNMAASLGLAGSEVFPKQSQVLSERGDLGNWMVMPYFGGTFGGKLREQVGLKKTGSALTLREFLNAAERTRVSELVLAELITPRRRKGKNGSGAEPFSDGPVCLQHLVSRGIGEGGRNNVLLMMGIYLKKVHPTDWTDRLEEYNRKYITPPLQAEEMVSTVRSLEKKDYEYTCKTEPMRGCCNAALCRTRRFGVGGDNLLPIITGLSKIDTDDPIWFVDVDDMRVEVSTEQLQTYTQFHLACLKKHKAFSAMKQNDWLAVLREAMETVVIIEAPPEVSTLGRFTELLEEFLTNRMRGQVREDLLGGRPWEDDEQARHYFRLRDIQSFINREGVRDMTRGQLTRFIDALGGGHHQLSIKNRTLNVWWVPCSAVSPPIQLPTPQQRRSAV